MIAMKEDEDVSDLLLAEQAVAIKVEASQRVSDAAITLQDGIQFGREVRLSCYGVPIHAWNTSTFSAISNYWGGVQNIDDGTTKCVRYDVGKVKIFT
ncbi:hypothetical protein Dimus_029424 [Dionaea muscipula]